MRNVALFPIEDGLRIIRRVRRMSLSERHDCTIGSLGYDVATRRSPDVETNKTGEAHLVARAARLQPIHCSINSPGNDCANTIDRCEPFFARRYLSVVRPKRALRVTVGASSTAGPPPPARERAVAVHCYIGFNVTDHADNVVQRIVWADRYWDQSPHGLGSKREN